MYGFEGTPEDSKPVIELLDRLRTRPGAAVTSEIVLGELLAPVRRQNATPVGRKRQIYLNLLVFNTFFDLQPVTRDIIIATADVRQVTGLKLLDAIHVVTGMRTDRDMRQLPAGLQRIPPDSAGIAELLRELK